MTLKTFEPSNFSISGNKVTVTLPAHSVVMLELTPKSVGTIFNAHLEKSQRISVFTNRNRIVVKHGLFSSTPVTLSLFTVDGKLAAPVFNTVVGTEAGTLVWQPNVTDHSNNTYILNMKADGVSHSQKVVLMK